MKRGGGVRLPRRLYNYWLVEFDEIDSVWSPHNAEVTG